MTNQQWLDGAVGNVINKNDLALGKARAFARLIESDEYGAATIAECRRSDDGTQEAVLIELEVDLGQVPPVNNIQLHEAVGFVFSQEGRAPFAMAMREDFPLHLPHVNAAPQGEARSFCLFEASAYELDRLYTPHRFVERVRWWLRETAYGRLHGNDQPLEPFFSPSPIPLVLPKGFRAGEGLFLAGFRQSDSSNCPIVFIPLTGDMAAQEDKLHSAIIVKTEPVEHGTLRWLPDNFTELTDAYEEVGINVIDPLAVKLKAWAAQKNHNERLRRPAILVISTPLQNADGETRGQTDKAFFLVNTNWLDVGINFGVLAEEGGMIGLLIKAATRDRDALARIPLVPADVHESLTRNMAQEVSGRKIEDTPAILLVGAGALGSQVAVTCAQGGYGTWSIVDSDHILPHNTVRHRLTGHAVGMAKAEAVALDIKYQLGESAATGIVKEIVAFEASDEFDELAARTELVIDASASVRVARMLARSTKIASRSVSMFLNPRGTSLVVLAEGDERSPRLDQLEMSYYWKLVCKAELLGHLAGRENTIAIGTCRSPTVQIPQTSMGMFAAIAAESVIGKEPSAEGAIEIWSASGQIDSISKLNWSGEQYRDVQVGPWSISIREQVLSDIGKARTNAGKLETGGILAGAWDLAQSRLHVVGHFDAPQDSIEEETGFVRGSVGVFHTIEHIESATAANLTYIGEWHTHPPGATSKASGEDAKLLRWIETAVCWNGVPAVMLIGAEDGIRIIIQEEQDRHELLLD